MDLSEAKSRVFSARPAIHHKLNTYAIIRVETRASRDEARRGTSIVVD